MAPRATASATISFGLISIPVKFYSSGSGEGSAVGFNMLNPATNNRLRQKYVDEVTGEEVKQGDSIKGFEIAPGKFVTFTRDELKAFQVLSSGTLDVQKFVPAKDLDYVWVSQTNYLAPEKGAEKGYRLLSEALTKTKTVAIARWSARGKQYVAAIRPIADGRLALAILNYADEIRMPNDVPCPELPETSLEELKLAVKLVNQATKVFDMSEYRDEVAIEIRKVIDQKAAGEEVVIQGPAEQAAGTVDLMAALKASLADTEEDAA